MAVQKGKSSLAAKLGDKLKKAHDAHIGDELMLGSGGDLPEGIEGGIAQLVECKLDVYKDGKNKGEFFFYAAAIVIKPKLVGDILVEGMRTTVGPEPLCDTPDGTGKKKTFDDHYAWVLNELRKIVGEETLKSTGYDQIESLCESIKEAAPYIRFRTWKGSKPATGPYKDREPRVMSDWRGVVENYQQENDTETVQDTTGDKAPVAEEKPAPVAKEAAKAPKAATSKGKSPPPPSVEVAAPEGSEEEDLDALAEAADAGDDEAIAKLVTICKAQDVDPEVPELENWVMVVALLREGPNGEATEGAEESVEADSFLPAKKEVYFFKPEVTTINPKTKKQIKLKAAKGIECTVIAVDEENQKVNLKSLADGKTIYKDIPFAELGSEA